MSVKRKKTGLVISWQKSFSILAPWRKKGDSNTVLDSEVVLTKLKLFSNFNERLLMADTATSAISRAERKILLPTKVSKVNSHLDSKSRQPHMESGSDYLPTIFSDSQLPGLYKFESEDSGVELPSGANSPSTPTESEQSFVVHSRESSCGSCNLNSAQQASSNPLGSGRGYLEHICQLIEKIGQLQETNLRLQRQICSLQKDSRMAKTKEDFFQQHCTCGAASLAFQDIQKRHSRNEFLSLSGTLSDLSTIPEVTQHPLLAIRRMRSEGLRPVPLWRRGLKRRSYTEGEVCFLEDSTEGLAISQRRLSENYTWGRVKDLVRKTKLREQSRLGLTSSSLKMSCPQLY
uniref:Uncharacterized protein n=1 Tax=Monopterus albus TaxID=43700 RepID=A0A3Q3QN11_MONAL